MKHRIFSFGSVASALVLAFAATCVSPSLAADDDSNAIRANCDTAFTRLTLNSKEALQSALKSRKKSIAANGADASKFKISAVGDPTADENESVAQAEAQMAIKIWFTLVDGTKVNPLKYEWSAKEKFYVHVQAATPVYVSLFYEIPAKDGKAAESHQVYPNKRYANSVEAIQAGRATRLPVQFEMDDNDEDEIMSMVVVRADWEGLQDGLTQPAASSVTNENGSLVVNAKIDDAAQGTLKCLNARASSPKALDVKRVKSLVRGASDQEAQAIAKSVNACDSLKFHISGSEVAESEEVDDVCFYMFASQKVGQWRLTIKK